MTQFIWLTDLHFSASDLVAGHQSHGRLDAAIDFVNKNYSDASFCLITGDLTDDGSAQDYITLRAHLDRLKMPYLPMVGNHDNRELVGEFLEVPANSQSGFVQYAVDLGDAALICLDTLKSGSVAVELCPERLEWLRATLEEEAGRPAFLAMHHPPLALGLPMQDPDNLQESDALLDLAQMHGQVSHLFLGHVHRPICGSVRGIPFTTMRSVLLQAPPPRPEWDWDSFKLAFEAPALGVVQTDGGDAIVQFVEFCRADYAGDAP